MGPCLVLLIVIAWQLFLKGFHHYYGQWTTGHVLSNLPFRCLDSTTALHLLHPMYHEHLYHGHFNQQHLVHPMYHEPHLGEGIQN